MIPDQFTIQFGGRDFGEISQPYLKAKVRSYGWNIYGGPDWADLYIEKSDPRAMWEYANLLRCPVTIYSNRLGIPVWWGIVGEVRLPLGRNPRDRLVSGASLEGMYNRVRVFYTKPAGDALNAYDPILSDWAENADSVSIYGRKELIDSYSDIPQDYAEALRDLVLQTYQFPLAPLSIEEATEGTIRCLGYSHTLDWTYLLIDIGLEQHPSANEGQTFGEQTSNTRLRQTFQISSSTAWDAKVGSVQIEKHGSPTDNALIRIYTDSGGNPGTLQGTITLPAASVPESADWYGGDFDSPVTLSPSTTYHLVLERSGSLDSSNHYQVGIDERKGYSSGDFKIWNGSSWVVRDPDCDLSFKLEGSEDVVVQMERMVDQGGEFIVDFLSDGLSGILSNPYREGLNKTLPEIQKLLKAGVSSGNEYMFQITPNRVFQLIEEPSFSESTAYQIDLQGVVYDPKGNRFLGEICPVGIWLTLKEGLIPSTANLSYISDPSIRFIPAAEYNTELDEYRPYTRGIEPAWRSILQLKKG